MTLTATDAELERLERAVGTRLARFGQKDGLAVAWTREDGACGPAEDRRRAGRGRPPTEPGRPAPPPAPPPPAASDPATPLPGGSGSSRPVRGCCTLEGASRAGRFGGFLAIPGFLLEHRFPVDELPCAERIPLHMGGFQRR